MYLREKKLAEALAEVEAAGKLNNKAPELNVLRAELAMMQNQPGAAEGFLKTAQGDAPAHSPVKLQLARLKMEERNYPAAKKLLDDLIKETPDYVPAWALRGQIALGEADLAECDRVTEAVLTWDPRHYDIRMLRARVMVLRQQIDKALLEFTQIDSLYPGVPEVKYETAVAHVMRGGLEESLKTPGRTAAGRSREPVRSLRSGRASRRRRPSTPSSSRAAGTRSAVRRPPLRSRSPPRPIP